MFYQESRVVFKKNQSKPESTGLSATQSAQLPENTRPPACLSLACLDQPARRLLLGTGQARPLSRPSGALVSVLQVPAWLSWPRGLCVRVLHLVCSPSSKMIVCFFSSWLFIRLHRERENLKYLSDFLNFNIKKIVHNFMTHITSVDTLKKCAHINVHTCLENLVILSLCLPFPSFPLLYSFITLICISKKYIFKN